MALRSYAVALSGPAMRLSDVYGGAAGVVDPMTNIAYRQLRLQASAADAIRITDGPLGYATQVVADGATAYWRLGETSGSTAVDVIGGFNGTISGGVTLGQAGALADGDKAMAFDATGEYVSVPNGSYAAIGTGTLSLECWIKSAVPWPGTSPFIIDNGGGANGAGFSILRSSTSAIGFKVANGTANIVTQKALIYDGQWHHIVGVLTRGTPNRVQIFVDGVAGPLDAPAADGWNITSSAALLFATYSGGQAASSFRYTGEIDEVAIYPTALTAPQIAAHYAARTLSSGAGASTPGMFVPGPSPAAPLTLGPFKCGPLRLSDLYASGTGTLQITGLPY